MNFNKKNAFLQIDFAFVLLIFFLLFFISYTLYESYKTNSINDLENRELLANAKDICNLLISNPGNPINWENNISNLTSIGLKNISSNSIDTNKLSKLNSSNYFIIVDKLYLNQSYVNLKIIGLKTNVTYINFGEIAQIKSFSNYVCYSNYNGEMVKLIVEVWK